MSTSLLYHAFGIRGYRYCTVDYNNGETIFTIHQELETYRRAACGSSRVIPSGAGGTPVPVPAHWEPGACSLGNPTCGMSGCARWCCQVDVLFADSEAELHQVLREICTGVIAERPSATWPVT